MNAQELEKKIRDLEDGISKLKDDLRFVKGQPTIQGYSGKRLDLNDNLNVVLLNKRLSTDETVISGKQDQLTNTDAEIVDAVTRTHDRSHAVDSTNDHTSSIPVNVLMKANASGLPVTSGITSDADNNVNQLNSLQFDTTPAAITNAEGLLKWNATDGTLDLGMSGGDVTMQVGQELFMKCRNVSGSTILNGSPVYVNGRTGNRPNIYLAKSDADSTSGVIGITTQDIASPADGFVTTFGYVRGIKTNYSGAGAWGTTWAEGDKLYVSKTVAGQLTNIAPSVPHHSDIVATVEIVHSNLGSILVNVKKHVTLEELNDVNGTALTVDGQFPSWNNTNKYFDFDKKITDYSLTTHTHSKIVASDGSPDPALSADASGNCTCVAKLRGATGHFGGDTHYSEFEADGTYKANGDATTFDDLLGDITRLKVVGVGIIAEDAENALKFQTSANLSDYALSNYQQRHRWKAGSSIYPHIHFEQTENNVPNFLIRYRWQRNGNTKTTVWTDYKCNTLAFTYVSGTLNQIAYGAAITAPAGYSISDIVELRIFRDNANTSAIFTGADPFTTDVLVTAIDIHIQEDTLGSRTEYTK